MKVKDQLKLLKLLFTKPYQFFKKIGPEKSLKNVFIIYVVFLALRTLLSILYVFVSDKAYFDANIAPKFAEILLNFVISVFLSFLSAGLTHIWIKLFKGKSSYVDTYKIYAYSRLPVFLLGWVPIIAVQLITQVYSLILLVIGAEVLHKMTRKRAITTFAVAIVLTLVIAYAISSQIYPNLLKR